MRRVAGVLVVVALVLAGCASIPTDSQVFSDGPAPPDRPVREVVVGPAAGAEPAEVVDGFVGASPVAPDGYGVARSYLTRARAETWRPEQSTVVYAGSTPLLTVAGAAPGVPGTEAEPAPLPEQGPVRATVAVDVVATVDADGRYLPAPTGTRQTYDVVLVREAGQWRIDEVPDVVLVSEGDFAFQYRRYPLWFIDPTGQTLVPESRWLPSGGAPTVTRVVSELLEGPSPWLQGAVRTAVPQGTSLAPPRSVTTQAGTTVVELTDQAREASGPERAAMRAQLLATLEPLLGATEVEIRVDGGALDVPDSEAPPGDPQESVGNPVLVDDTSLVQLSGDRLLPVAGLGPIEGLGATDPAVSLDATRFAVLTSERSQLRLLEIGTTTEPDVALVGSDLTSPSLDRRGWTWSTSAACEGVVTAVSRAGEVVEVEAGWLAGRRVTALRVSRDATRALVVSTGPDGVGAVDLAGVVRSGAEGAPLRLDQAPASSVAPRLVQASLAVWTDADEVAVLGSEAADDLPRVHLVSLGSPTRPARAVVEDVVDLAAGLGSRSLLVARSDGTLLTPSGSTWAVLVDAAPARDPAYPG